MEKQDVRGIVKEALKELAKCVEVEHEYHTRDDQKGKSGNGVVWEDGFMRGLKFTPEHLCSNEGVIDAVTMMVEDYCADEGLLGEGEVLGV